MAKHTNKTNHILNLLSGDPKKKEKEEEHSGASTEPPVLPKGKKAADSNLIEEEQTKVVVDVINKKDDEKINEELVNDINSALEEELQEYEQAKGSVLSQEPEIAVDLDLGDDTEDEEDYGSLFAGESTLTEEYATDQKEFIDEQKDSIEDQKDFVIDQDKEDLPDIVSDEKQEEVEETKEELVDVCKDEEDPDKNEEVSYITINVMEKLVDLKALEYMNKFGVCTCDRCVADVKALALTNLNAKYVVSEKSSVAPLINFYERKFESDLVVQLTKACITVDENPHH